ncbi:MAG: hypothetical protein H7Y42_17995 [Chitinophagaceae bacterium]|nr:hypothetical protein [Chitinophagaceae bacterium]
MNPIDSKYKNMPDKVSVTKITRDGNTGAVLDTDSSVQDAILTYNGYSFLSSINFGTTANTRRDLIYNK